MANSLNDLGTHVLGKFPDKKIGSALAHGELTLTCAAADIVPALTFLRDDEKCQFEVLIDICGVDYPEREKRFDVVYHLLSPRLNQRIRVKIEPTT